MTPLDLTAVALVCVTQVVVAWLVAERWYAHRDRAVQQIATSSQTTMGIVREETVRMVQSARSQIADALRASQEDTETRLRKLENDFERLDHAMKTRILGGRS